MYFKYKREESSFSLEKITLSLSQAGQYLRVDCVRYYDVTDDSIAAEFMPGPAQLIKRCNISHRSAEGRAY